MTLPKATLQVELLSQLGTMGTKFGNKTNALSTSKDPLPKEYHSSAVYKFTCPSCQASYIGKTDRCLYTRINEHTYCNKSEIYKHINSCEHILHIQYLLNLPSKIFSYGQPTN